MTDSEASPLLTATQLAARWRIPVRTIYAWARSNTIPHYRAGRLLRFDTTEVEEHFRSTGVVGEVVPDGDRPGEAAFSLLTAS